MSDSTTLVHASPGRADSHLVGEIKALLVGGETAQARKRFAALVDLHQRRATRIAFYYLRDPADVDEAVQDAFLKAFLHLPSFREEFFFEFWFTRIVVNGCLDRLKARKRRTRWLLPAGTGSESAGDRHEQIDRRERARVRRVGHVDDGGARRPAHVADVERGAVDPDLPAAGAVDMGEPAGPVSVGHHPAPAPPATCPGDTLE